MTQSVEAASDSRSGWQGTVGEWNRRDAIAAGSLIVSAITLTLNLIPRLDVPIGLTVPILSATVWLMAVWIRRWCYSRAKLPFPVGEHFRGAFAEDASISPEMTLTDVQHGQAVCRLFDIGAETNRLIAILRGGGNRPNQTVVVAGPSGIGKSVLLKLLKSRLGVEKDVAVFLGAVNGREEEPSACMVRAREFVDTCDPKTLAIVILDQFEACMDGVIGLYRKPISEFASDLDKTSDLNAKELRALIRKSQTTANMRLVVAIRSDRYADLAILGEACPVPSEAFFVEGVGDGSARESLKTLIARMADEQDSAELILEDLERPKGRILPIRAQIVGLMLEQEAYCPPDPGPLGRVLYGSPERSKTLQRRISAEDYFSKRIGGGDGLTERYFERLIRSSPDPQVARELLFVMAIEGRVKTRYSLDDLSRIIFRSAGSIGPTLDHLTKNNVVANWNGRYALIHDYLAIQYFRMSGRLIEPVVRDNLSYSQARAAAEERDSRKSPETVPVLGLTVLWSLRLVMLVGFTVRLFWFRQFPLPYADVIGADWWLDWYYLPLALAQLCWGLYVVELVRRIFIWLDDSLGAKLASWGLPVLVLAGMTWTAFAPSTWLIWIGVIGFAVGMKFLWIGRKIKRSLTGRNRFSVIGLYTPINAAIFTYVGAVRMRNVHWDLPISGQLQSSLADFFSLTPSSEFSSVYYVVALLLTYWVYMYRAHVRPNSAVEFIGWYRRIEARRAVSIG